MTTAGRKRSFDKEQALETAMRVFWDNGFAGTSMSDLTSALGINKPSLYAAFGNKEQLFQAAIEYYVQRYGAPQLAHLTGPRDTPLAQRLQNFLYAMVENMCSEDGPKGCFVVKTCCESGGDGLPEEISSVLQTIGDEFESSLCSILLDEQQQGQLDSKLNVKDLVAYLLSLVYGLSVMGRRGKSCDELRSVVQTAMQSLAL